MSGIPIETIIALALAALFALLLNSYFGVSSLLAA